MLDRSMFIQHLRALSKAIDQVQPLADYRGNFDAIHSLVMLDRAAKQIISDVEALWSEEYPEQPPRAPIFDDPRAQLLLTYKHHHEVMHPECNMLSRDP